MDTFCCFLKQIVDVLPQFGVLIKKKLNYENLKTGWVGMDSTQVPSALHTTVMFSLLTLTRLHNICSKSYYPIIFLAFLKIGPKIGKNSFFKYFWRIFY